VVVPFLFCNDRINGRDNKTYVDAGMVCWGDKGTWVGSIGIVLAVLFAWDEGHKQDTEARKYSNVNKLKESRIPKRFLCMKTLVKELPSARHLKPEGQPVTDQTGV
jgi:hypothetical protein